MQYVGTYVLFHLSISIDEAVTRQQDERSSRDLEHKYYTYLFRHYLFILSVQ